jgi:hypothetical protein
MQNPRENPDLAAKLDVLEMVEILKTVHKVIIVESNQPTLGQGDK